MNLFRERVEIFGLDQACVALAQDKLNPAFYLIAGVRPEMGYDDHLSAGSFFLARLGYRSTVISASPDRERHEVKGGVPTRKAIPAPVADLPLWID